MLDYFLCQSDLCSNCKERSPKVYQFRSSQQEKFQNGSKLDSTNSALDPLRTIKRKERSSNNPSNILFFPLLTPLHYH